MSRKPNSNATLKNLPQAKRKEIFERFETTPWQELLTQLRHLPAAMNQFNT